MRQCESEACKLAWQVHRDKLLAAVNAAFGIQGALLDSGPAAWRLVEHVMEKFNEVQRHRFWEEVARFRHEHGDGVYPSLSLGIEWLIANGKFGEAVCRAALAAKEHQERT